MIYHLYPCEMTTVRDKPKSQRPQREILRHQMAFYKPHVTPASGHDL